jgi:hypothetical protein
VTDRVENETAVPRAEYSRRLAELSAEHAKLQHRERRVGYFQLALAVFTVAWPIVRMSHFSRVDLLILLPVSVFVTVAAVHGRLQRAVATNSRSILFYKMGLARLDGSWAGAGVTGERFLEPSHPCARDLDIFGRGSIFELLCTARTRAGEESLARWLLEAAPPDEIRARQTAAIELRDRVAFRESLFITGEELELGVRPTHLIEWGEAEAILPGGMIRIAAPVLAAVWIGNFLAWFFLHTPGFLLLASTVINLLFSYRFRPGLDQAVHAAEEAGHDLNLLSQVLAVFEQENFTSPRLLQLQAQLRRPGTLPSRAIARLNRVVVCLESAHHQWVRIVDPVIFYRLQFVFAAENWRRRFGPSLRQWLASVGELEALAALAGYTYEHHEDVFPEFVDRAPCFEAVALAHPLIPRDRAVGNDLCLDGNLHLMIVSGPNMAGKSTFLRGIGVNTVLAQSGAPVRAASLRLSPLAVTASICVLDSLEGGISRFYAEIHRLKQIMDLTRGPVPVLFLLDELLSGTNSHDRLIGTLSIVTGLVERGAVGLVTTHDLALTAIPEGIGSQAVNCHFEDHLEDGQLCFDYKLYPGVVQTSNALPLMRSIGLEV